MKLTKLIENKITLKQKSYIRFSILSQDTTLAIADNHNNLNLFRKSKEDLIENGLSNYSNLNSLQSKNLKHSKAVINCEHNITNLQIIQKLNTSLDEKNKSFFLLKPLKGGFSVLLSNGIIGFISQQDIIKITKLLSVIVARKQTGYFYLKGSNKYVNPYDFFKLKLLGSIADVNIKFYIKKVNKTSLLSEKSMNIKFTIKPNTNYNLDDLIKKEKNDNL